MDEAPQCYKDLTDVLSHHRSSVFIADKLVPLGVVMGSGNGRRKK